MLTTCRSAGMTAGAMPHGTLRALAPLVRRHPWWRARARLALAWLRRAGVLPPGPVLDIGCGWGVTLNALEKAGYAVVGLDLDREMLEDLEQQNPRRTLVHANLLAYQPDDLPARPQAVLALDVLEHLEDDARGAESLASLVAPEGVVLVSVPALPELWSEFDEVQGHHRRYHPERLRSILEHAGLTVETIHWWGQWLVPLLRAQRHGRGSAAGLPSAEVYASYLSLPPWPLPWFLDAAFACEHPRALRGRCRCGTSLWAVARRL